MSITKNILATKKNFNRLIELFGRLEIFQNKSLSVDGFPSAKTRIEAQRHKQQQLLFPLFSTVDNKAPSWHKPDNVPHGNDGLHVLQEKRRRRLALLLQ